MTSGKFDRSESSSRRGAAELIEEAAAPGSLNYQRVVEVAPSSSRSGLELRTDAELLKHKLTQGLLPIELLKAFNIVYPDLPISSAIQQPLHELSRKLGFHDSLTERSRFLIYRSEVPGLHYLQHSSPPLLLISSATFRGNQGPQTVDAFAYLLARALHHAHLFDQHGEQCDQHLRQGIPEFRAVESLQLSGYVPDACLRFLPKLIRVTDGRLCGQGSEHFINPNPAPPERVMAIYAGLARAAKCFGALNTNETAITELDPLCQLFTEIERRSQIEQVLFRSDFERRDADQQLKLLSEIISSISDFNTDVVGDLVSAVDAVGRIRPTEEELAQAQRREMLEPDPIIPTRSARAAFLNSLEGLLRNENHNAYIELFKATTQKWHSPEVLDQIVVLKPIRDSIRAFINGHTVGEIYQAACTMQKLVRENPALHSALYEMTDELDWPSFSERQSRTGARDWDPHLNALAQMSSSDAVVVLDLLKSMQLSEFRMFELHPDAMWELHFDQFAGRMGFLSRSDKPPHALDYERKIKEFVFEHGERLASRGGDGEQRQLDRERLLKLDDPDGWVFIKDLSLSMQGKVFAPGLIERDPQLFISLNRLALLDIATQANIVKILEQSESREVVRKFFKELVKSPHLAAGFAPPGLYQFMTDWRNIPLLNFALDRKELTPLVRWKTLVRSGICQNYYLPHGDAGKTEDFLEYKVRPLIAQVAARKQPGASYPDDIALDWEDLFNRLSVPELRGLPGHSLLADMESRVLLDDTPPRIADVVRLNEVVPIYADLHQGLRYAIIEKSAATLVLSDDTIQAIREWAALHRFSLFESRDQSYRTLDALLPGIVSIGAPGTRRQLIEELLLAPEGFEPAQIEIFDRPLVARLIEIWCVAAKEDFLGGGGVDDRSNQALREGIRLADLIAHRAPASYQKEWLQNFAKRIESQETLTIELKRSVDLVADDLASSSALLHSMSRDLSGFLHLTPFIRRLTMEMLLSEGTSGHINYFVSSALENYRLAVDGSHLNTDDGREFCAAPSRSSLHDWAILAHRLFPQQSVEQQTLMVMQLLAPPHIPDPEYQRNAMIAPSARDESEALDLMLAHALPSTKAQQVLGGYIRAFFAGLDRYERFSTATLLLQAEHHRRSSAKGIGYSFAWACKEQGPFETWIAQNTQSNPSVSKKLRDDMSCIDIKTNVNEPLRWDALPWIRKSLPPRDFAEFNHIGDTLGSGKVWVTFAAESESFGSEALQLRRPHAHNLINAGVNRWKRASRLMAERGLPVTFFNKMLPSAHESCITEADVHKSPAQFELAHRLLHGRQVEILSGNALRHFTYQVPILIAYGENEAGEAFRRMTRLPGHHFIDLERVGVPESERIMVAASNFSMFLSHIFAARGHNRDPHGGNNRVHGSMIGCFDFGGMDLAIPDDSAVQQFSELFFASLFKASDAVPLGERMMNEILRNLAEQQAIAPFTYSAMQSILALSDCISLLPSDIHFAAIAGALHATTTHAQVLATLDKLLGTNLGSDGFVAPQRALFERFYSAPTISVK